MKITFINTNLNIGGAERTVEYLANNFVNEHQVDVISIDGSNKFKFDDKIDLVKFNIPTEYSNIFQRFNLVIKRYKAMYNYFKSKKPDKVICIQCENIKYVKWLQKRYKFKIVVSERSNPKNVNDSKYLNKADGIIFQTARAKQCYSKIIQDKSIVIQNAVGNPLVKEISLPKERRKAICALGRVTYEKDYLTLINAFELFNNKFPEYILEIYGDRHGKYSDELHQYINKLKNKDKIFIFPASTDALFKICDSSCYVLSSISEGMPNSLMEAMAIGLPCVATNCQFGPSELIENELNGLLVEPKNVKQLADAMERIIKDKEFAKNVGQSAQKILQTNSIENISKLFLRFTMKE